MRKGIATVSVGGTLTEKLDAISAARFDGIEIFDADLISAPLSPAELARRCADLGLSIDLFQPVRDVEGTPPERFDAVLHRVRSKLRVMGELGVDRMLICSSVAPDAITEDRDLMAEQLAAVGDLAAEAGVLVGYEALAWGRTTSRFVDSWDVVQRCDHANVGVVVDTFHMLGRGDGPQALAGVPGERIAFLQVADAPRMGMQVLEWSRHFRCFPGQGNLEVAPLVAEVYARGYRGPLSLEIFSDVVREADPRATALDAMRSLLHLEEELREIWSAEGAGTRRPRVELFDPPPAPERVDAAFVEIAVGGEFGSGGIQQTLSGLGFSQVGTHRGLPVHWWRNGDAHIVLNALPTAAPLSVTALGVGVGDPLDVASRAEALLWPRARSRRRPGDAPLPGLDTPGGLAVFLSAGEHGDGWQVDFRAPASVTMAERARNERDEATDAPLAEEGTGLGIDHVGASIDPNLLPAEQSFFRTVLGMRAGALSEFMQPGGRMRSRPLTPAVGDLRVIVSVDDGTRPDEARRGLNQVAIAVSDIFTVVEQARRAGLKLMPVPDNYYVDLAARFPDLDAELVTRLRSGGVLYDRDETGGELFHVYTPILGNGFYLEVLQRTGGYAGYGAPNTVIRLAAHAEQRERDPLER
ncbi:sugar phosphate isomerase/epimerase and 4-hydroxyphenylpyruvate domain-containing protein [Enemella evansiae]|uniref:sugar phosphate isomerase/epimerase and 4-hydroxyphenylpyruvate domain-containing protein n=1 Tax=Enemella evansiae TaxID=2016499 RepID=UPI0010618D8D|nr:sugar phosphate isomerase/epimerase and 4-hydroxyphenylpyruvate domain-containing protein [Enemella evansiae]TDO89497.1 4-hydroxyphenylpyruvate dioxygenase [Enemella evansiae]